MVRYYATLSEEAGDTVTATPQNRWSEGVANDLGVQTDSDVTIEIGERKPLPDSRDTFEATVNGVETELHIDTLTDIFVPAGSLTYER